MIFFFCFNEKVLMKSQIFLIIEHATSAKTYFSATKVWEKCALITAFVTENRKKGLLELKHLFVGSKLEILTFYWRVPRTTKCSGLLSKDSNFILLLCLLTSYSSVPNRRACTIIILGGKSLVYMTLFGPTRLLILRNFFNLHVYSILQAY